jgi:hypothetical protein
MQTFKIYSSLLLALANVALLGAYASSTISNTIVIEPYQWVITTSIAVLFLCMFLHDYRKQTR